MRTSSSWLGLIVVLALAVPAVVGDEEKVPLDKLPQKIVDAVKAKFPDAKLVSAEKEKENNEIVYEVAIKNKDQKIEVTLKEDGTIIEIEKQIDAKDLPKVVSDALESKYPKATYKLVSREE